MGPVSIGERPYVEVWQEGKRVYEFTLVTFSFAMDLCIVSQAAFNIMFSNSNADVKNMLIRDIICFGTFYSTWKCLSIYDRKFQWIRNLEYPYNDVIHLPTSNEIQIRRRRSPERNKEVFQSCQDVFLGVFALQFQLKLMSAFLFTRAISQVITMREGPELIFINIIRQQDGHKRCGLSRCAKINQKIASIGKTIWGAVSGLFLQRRRHHA